MSQHDEAATLFQRVLTVYESELGKQHADTLTTLAALGDANMRVGRLKEAEAQLRRAFNAQTNVLGAADVHTVATGHNLARTLTKRGTDRDEADTLCVQVRWLAREATVCECSIIDRRMMPQCGQEYQLSH